MIVSREEFLLLAQNWRNSSATVRLVFKYGGKETPNPLSSALIVRLSVRILGIDEESSYIACAVGEDGLVSVGFGDSSIQFGVAEDTAFQSLVELENPKEVEEMATVCLATGLDISFIKFK